MPLVPLFVVGFLAMVVVGSAGLVPDGVLDAAATARSVLLAAALFSLGASLDLRSLAVTGRRAAAVGLVSWVLIASTSLLGLHLVGCPDGAVTPRRRSGHRVASVVRRSGVGPPWGSSRRRLDRGETLDT